MGIVSTDTIAALERTGIFIARLEGSESATKAPEAAPANLTLERSPGDALAATKTDFAATETVAIAHAERARIIAEAQATARDIVAPWFRRLPMWQRLTASEQWISPTASLHSCGRPKKKHANLRQTRIIFGTVPLVQKNGSSAFHI